VTWNRDSFWAGLTDEYGQSVKPYVDPYKEHEYDGIRNIHRRRVDAGGASGRLEHGGRAMRRVIVEPWKADPRFTHVHEEGFDGIHSLNGSVAHLKTEEVRAIGHITGQMIAYGEGGTLYGGCHEFCETCEDISDLCTRQIEDARSQLYSYFGDDFRLSDIEIACLDWMCRKALAEQAEEVDNPWQDSHTVRLLVSDIVKSFMSRLHPNAEFRHVNL